MQRVRVALALIQREPHRAEEVLRKGVQEAPEVFIPGVAHFIREALQGVVIDPDKL